MRLRFIWGTILLIVFGSSIINQATLSSTPFDIGTIDSNNLQSLELVASLGEIIAETPQNDATNCDVADEITHYSAWMMYDYTTKAWHITERNRLINAGQISPDCSRFAGLYYSIDGSSATVYAIFDATTDELLVELRDSVTDLAVPVFVWSPDGLSITDGIRSWSTSTGELLASLSYQGMSLGLPDAYWSEDSRYILMVEQNQYRIGEPITKLYFWDASSGAIIYEKGFWHKTQVIDVRNNIIHAISSGGYRYDVQIDILTGDIVSAELIDNQIVDIQSIAWSADGTQFVVIAGGPSQYPMQLWKRDTVFSSDEPKPIWSIASDWYRYEELSENYYPSTVDVFWVDNERIVTTTRHYWINRTFHSIDTWRTSDGETVTHNYWSYDEWHPPMAEISPDMTRIAEFYPLSNDEDKVRILDVTTHVEQRTLTRDAMTAIAWSSTGNWLATFDIFGQDKTVEIWDMNTEDENPAIVIEASPYGISWSPDDRLITLENSGSVEIYDSHSGEKLGEISSSITENSRIAETSWNPDGTILCVGIGSEILFWSVEESEIIFTFEIPSDVTNLAWSPDGKLIATTHSDNVIRLWGVPSTDE